MSVYGKFYQAKVLQSKSSFFFSIFHCSVFFEKLKENYFSFFLICKPSPFFFRSEVEGNLNKINWLLFYFGSQNRFGQLSNHFFPCSLFAENIVQIIRNLLCLYFSGERSRNFIFFDMVTVSPTGHSCKKLRSWTMNFTQWTILTNCYFSFHLIT